MSDDSRVQELLQRAAEYATMSVESVLCWLEEDQGMPSKVFHDYARLVHGLEVHFLFPNLSATERDLLVTLLEVRGAVLIHLSKMGHGQLAPTPTGRATALAELQRRLVDLQAQAASRNLTDKLTPLQRSILQKEFFSASFSP